MTRLAVVVLAACAAAGLTAADWPQRGRDAARNAVSPEAGAPTDFQLPVRSETGAVVKAARGVAWAAPLGDTTVVAPVVAGGPVWACTSGRSRGTRRSPRRTGTAACSSASTRPTGRSCGGTAPPG